VTLGGETTGKKVKGFQMDNGGEFTSNEIKAWCNDNGIKIFYTMPYSPEQNGIVERTNRALNEKVTTMMSSAKVPKEI
jgi:transposase InsO family protein